MAEARCACLRPAGAVHCDLPPIQKVLQKLGARACGPQVQCTVTRRRSRQEVLQKLGARACGPQVQCTATCRRSRQEVLRKLGARACGPQVQCTATRRLSRQETVQRVSENSFQDVGIINELLKHRLAVI